MVWLNGGVLFCAILGSSATPIKQRKVEILHNCVATQLRQLHYSTNLLKRSAKNWIC